MKSIKELKNIKGKKVLVRVDFNVPIKDGKVIDDFRIKAAVPTISFLQKKGAIIILMAHLGDDGSKSLEPVYLKLKKMISGIKFVTSSIHSNETGDIISSLKNGEVVLLENIRRDEGEKKNMPSFARGLSRLAEFYVNDAFSVSHRAHASTVGITKYLPGFAGFQLIDEINNLSKSFK